MVGSTGSSCVREDHPDNGPIVFYSSSLFCSDLSGDRAPTNMRRPNSQTTRHVLGVSAEDSGKLDELRDPDITYLRTSTLGSIPEHPLGSFTLDLPSISESGECEGEPVELQASGIGGVTPQDNFIMDVKVARRPYELHTSGSPGAPRHGAQRYMYHVDACSRIDLAASLLPPPSYMFLPFQSSSSSNVDDDASSEDEGSEPLVDEDQTTPPMFLQHFSTESSAPKGRRQDGDGESSIYMLAPARTVRPRIVAAQEEELELKNKATTLQTEVIAGSLAATAGNGSDGSANSVTSNVDEAGIYMDTDDDGS